MATYDPGASRIPPSFNGRRLGIPRLVEKKIRRGRKRESGEGGTGSSGESGVLGVRGAIKKTLLPHIVLRLHPATIVCREEKSEGNYTLH